MLVGELNRIGDVRVSSERSFIPLNIAVLTVSDSRNEQNDASGKLLVTRLTDAGHVLFEKLIVPDDVYQIRAVVSRCIADSSVNAVLTTGGTVVTGRDGAPLPDGACLRSGWRNSTRPGGPAQLVAGALAPSGLTPRKPHVRRADRCRESYCAGPPGLVLFRVVVTGAVGPGYVCIGPPGH